MIAVLLSSYNGGLFLSAQLESIIKQTYSNYTIYIRDDGSTDNTKDIIRHYELLNPDKIVFLYDTVIHRGPRHSFMWMLNKIDADYYMFCDQDDVWFPDKIAISYNKIREIETIYGNSPVLVHTDMKIVDSNLEIISESLYKTMRIKPNIVDTFNYMGVCSCGPGCSMIFNNLAKKVSLNYESLEFIPMHDWWIAINTVKQGKVCFCPIPTMLYRQHNSNTVGAFMLKSKYSSYILKKVIRIKSTISSYKEEQKWLRMIGYGGYSKFLFYKLLYTIRRSF